MSGAHWSRLQVGVALPLRTEQGDLREGVDDGRVQLGIVGSILEEAEHPQMPCALYNFLLLYICRSLTTESGQEERHRDENGDRFALLCFALLY